MCMALKHLHSKRKLHRDIKSDNILINKDDYMLGDFGTANDINSGTHGIGTQIYSAPEIAQNK